MRKIFVSIILLAISGAAFGQNFKEVFYTAFEDDDTLKMVTVLAHWKNSSTNSWQNRTPPNENKATITHFSSLPTQEWLSQASLLVRRSFALGSL